MRTAGIVVTVLAIICAGIGGILQRDATGDLASMRELERLDLANLDTGQRGWIDATVDAPAAPVKGPVSQAQVAWWQEDIERRWEQYDDCASKTDGNCVGRWKDRSERVNSTRSGDAFAIRDGDANALVRLGTTDEVTDLDVADTVSRDEPSRDSSSLFERDGARRDSRLVREERSLREGERLLVLAKVASAGDAPTLVALDDLPIATVGTTYERRVASLERSQGVFGLMLWGGLAAAVIGFGLLIASLVLRRGA